MPSANRLPSHPSHRSASVGCSVTDERSWWASNAVNYPATATLASQYLSAPATSAQSERQFSAAGRLISKLRARLDGNRVDTLIFLYKNM